VTFNEQIAFGAKEEPQLPGATLNPLTAAEYDTVVGNVAATEPKFCTKIVWVLVSPTFAATFKVVNCAWHKLSTQYCSVEVACALTNVTVCPALAEVNVLVGLNDEEYPATALGVNVMVSLLKKVYDPELALSTA
jgi:hypothetical protein